MVWKSQKQSFFDYFDAHAKEIKSAAESLNQLFSENSASEELAKKIKANEHAADAITHAVATKLNRESMPIMDAEDITRLTNALDDVIDFMDDSTEAFVEIYELKETTPFAKRFADVILRAAIMLAETCPLLRKAGHNAVQIRKNCIELHRLENEGDDIKKEALKILFSMLKKSEISIATYLAWEEIYRTLEIITDKAEDCANIFEQIANKYSY